MSRILPRFTDTRLQDEAKLARILLETGEPAPPPTTLKEELTKPGDPRKLRGIPCIARGVGGTSTGTNPLAALIAKERRTEPHNDHTRITSHA